MVVDNHPLARDFPEHKDRIHALKTQNSHFARLNADYEAVDKAAIRLETGKRQPVAFKDELYAMQQNAA